MQLLLVAILLTGSWTIALAAPPLPQIPFAADRAAQLSDEWSKALGVDASLTNSIGLKLALIPPGRFTMGPSGSTYRVTLTRAFYIGTTEVTLGQYRRWKPGHSVQ